MADRIVAAQPNLSKKHSDIARFILAHLEMAAYASASELGARTGTSAATVVRFCQALGYDGYPQLQAAVRERTAVQRRAVQRLQERMAGPIPDDDLLAGVFAVDMHNIELTAARTSAERLKAAAAEMRHCRQVLIVGSGMAAVLVECLAYALQMVNVPARIVTGGEEPLALALAFLQQDDVVVSISFRKNPRYSLKAIEQARTVGAKSVGISDSELSPLVQEADYAFQVVSSSLAPSPSPAGAVALLNALIASLATSTPDQTAQSLHQIDATYRRRGLLDE